MLDQNLKLYVVLSLLIISLVLAISCSRDNHHSPLPTLEIKTPEQIQQAANQSIIFITRGNYLQGSGVIIDQTPKALFILTSIHVIGIKPSEKINQGDGIFDPGDPYIITTYNQEKFTIDYSSYERDIFEFPEDTDLVVLKLKYPHSQNNLKSEQIAKLTDNIQENAKVYLMGYLPCLNFSEEEVKYFPQIQFSVGKILEIKKSQLKSIGNGLKGYDIKYNNNTVKGMSGSPIFDASGRVVAIHAATEIDKANFDASSCQNLPEDPQDNWGSNWGISIKKFAQIQNSHLRDVLPTLSKHLSIDKRSLPAPLPSSPLCGPFISVDDQDCSKNHQNIEK